MKKITFLSGLFLTLLLKGQTNIHLIGYHKEDLWLEEKNGNYGLRAGDKIMVPYLYDLVLPTLQDEFAFVVKGSMIGVYDIKAEKEIELTANFNELEIFPGKDGAYYLQYLNQSYGNQNIQHHRKLIRDASGKIKMLEGERFDSELGDCNYRNGILRIDSLHFVHHFTKLDWEKNYGGQDGEEQITYSYANLLQRSGVFSLAKKDFIIPAQYSEIDVPLGHYGSSLYSEFIRVFKAEDAGSFLEPHVPEKLKDPDDIYLYGLYDTAYNLIQPPQKNRLHLSLNGGYYKYQDHLEVYDEHGHQIFSFPDSVQMPASVIRMKDRVYIGYDSPYIGELEMRVYHYNVYTLEKRQSKKEVFSFEDYIINGKSALVRVTSEPDSFDILYGVYDLEKSRFLISPEYKSIEQIPYKYSLFGCDPGKCDYYYLCYKNKTEFYFNRNFEPIQLKNVIDIDLNFSSGKSDELGIMLEPQITPVVKTDKRLSAFVQAGIKIDVTCYCYFNPDYFEELYYGEIVETHKGLNILKVYHSPKEKPTYGLYYQNSTDFIIEPFFQKMEFDLKNNALKITYNNKSGLLLLERYFNEN